MCWSPSRDPAASFAGLTRQSPWDEFQVAYFAGEANWNYFTAPFILARSDFTTEETKPWHEDGQTWRSLLVTYPDSIVAHTSGRPTTSTTPGCSPVQDSLSIAMTSLTSPSAERGNRSKLCALTSHPAGPFPTTS